MLALLLFAAAQNAVAEDRADFEQFWTEDAKPETLALIPKETAWHFYQFTRSQWALGYCSQFIPADVMAEMREYPPETDPRAAEFRRGILDQAEKAFRNGMAFRNEVKPTISGCEKELAERWAAMQEFRASKRPR